MTSRLLVLDGLGGHATPRFLETRDPLDGAPPDIEVWAAGGLVRRRVVDEPEVLVVHRPHRRDWSLPKGKLDGGETLAEAAGREITEETGLDCEIGPARARITYRDSRDRRKAVVYFEATVIGGAFTANDEVDEIRWVGSADATELLSYPQDRELVRRLVFEHPTTARG